MPEKWKEFELDLNKNELRGKKEVVRTDGIKSVEEIGEYNPEFADWLKSLGCKKVLFGWAGYGKCITKDGRLLDLDLKERHLEREIKDIKEDLKYWTRGWFISPEEWGAWVKEIPVKIIGLEKLKEVL
jgi:hypothetical protein